MKHKAKILNRTFFIFKYWLNNIYLTFCGVIRIQSCNKVGKVVSEVGNFGRSLWRRTIFSNKGVRDIAVEKIPRTKDSILTLDGRESGVQGAWCNPKGDKGNLVSNGMEEKKKEGQGSRPLHIKCTTTTYLAALMEKWPWTVSHTAHILVSKPSSKILMWQLSGEFNRSPPNVWSRCILAKLYKAKKCLDQRWYEIFV